MRYCTCCTGLAGVLGLFAVATLPTHRRRRLASILVATAVKAAGKTRYFVNRGANNTVANPCAGQEQGPYAVPSGVAALQVQFMLGARYVILFCIRCRPHVKAFQSIRSRVGSPSEKCRGCLHDKHPLLHLRKELLLATNRTHDAGVLEQCVMCRWILIE
jgi:hypothetical protein